MNTEILLDKPKDETNYFYHFNFSKFKKILYPLAIAALLFIIKQFITNNFYIPRSGGLGLLDAFDSFDSAKELPVWAEIINKIIDILIMVVVLCWEAVYEKKYNKIKFILLLFLPSTVLDIVYMYAGLNRLEFLNSLYSIYFIMNFFPTYSLYGVFRRKILYGEKLSLMGYLIGMITVISISTIYQKIGSVILINDFLTSLYSYGNALIKVFIPLSFFYFIFLSDAGFSFKNFIKMPATSLLTNKNFTAHFIILFSSLFALHLNLTENVSQYAFAVVDPTFSTILYTLLTFFRIILQIAFVYLLFSQLLLLQLSALRRKPLWIYFFSFIPVINLIPLFLFFRKSIPLTDTQYFEVQNKDQQNRSLLQFFILFLATIYAIHTIAKIGLSREYLICLVLPAVLLYVFILYFRFGIWIAFTLVGIAILFFLFQDMETGLYYTCLLLYGAIGLYNLHIALFWTAKEWDEIEENIIPENIQEV
ncbi:hypothetical protein [Flavobacterium sp. ASV13]|uniref:hypothetical protein n=1 Tax=Flavobacterium sp. ASV13 TaxID=1506583 RepID=UPI00055544C5|nr:hypothetical protein [Flavobacterium sp. ASV13]